MRFAYRVVLGLAGAVSTAGRRARSAAIPAGLRAMRRGKAPATGADAERPAQRAGLFGWLRGASDKPAEGGRDRPRRGLSWALRGLLAASLAVPLLLLATAAWQNFRLVQV